ncbi:sensor histidine kinase [Sphingomonas sp. M6A6_1c]
MAYSRGWRALGCAAALVGCGMAADAAWRAGLWGTLAGALLAAVWLAALTWWLVVRQYPVAADETEAGGDGAADRLVLDAAPTPMVMIDGGRARALNRAARRLFGTDDRLLPVPQALVDADASHLRHEGRQWRIDRVMLGGLASERSVAALIDVEQEERVAEARATAEMIHVLGHELLNGLAPIVSLAESGEAALGRPDLDPALLREILGTLARRAEGLQRFTEAYRELARLPAPRLAPVPLSRAADDLARLFAGRWPQVALDVRIEDGPDWPLDRDQLHQALWAVLQNAAEAATADRGPDARVALTIRYAGTEMVAEVQDNGGGVTPDDAARIFRPFHTTKPEGTGIGLSLARHIALAHGGSLILLPVRPTTFRFAVPSPITAAARASPRSA